jgi:ABC-type transport system substrate-binding protein
LSATSNKRWGLIVGGAAVVALGVFAYIKFATGPQEKEFSLIKPWFEPQGSGEVLSSGFFWVHRQCHESLVDTEVSGQILKRSAADVNRRGPRTWAFRISADAKWSDDGKAVTADDFVNAFTARSEKIRAPEFLRIKKVTAE